MSSDIIGVEDFNIYLLGAEAVSYHLKDIHTLGLQVTRENIGIIAIELRVELRYNQDGEPFLNIRVQRGSDENPRRLVLRPNDWVVVLWDEIHLFQDYEFKCTFSFDGLTVPTPTKTKKDAESVSKIVRSVGAQIKENFRQPTQVMTPVGAPGIEESGPMTEISPTVGELDTDEANGSVE